MSTRGTHVLTVPEADVPRGPIGAAGERVSNSFNSSGASLVNDFRKSQSLSARRIRSIAIGNATSQKIRSWDQFIIL